MAMNKSDATEEEKEIGSQIQAIVGRVPKKNHDAALQIYKQSSDLFRRYGLLRSGFSNSTIPRHTMKWALPI